MNTRFFRFSAVLCGVLLTAFGAAAQSLPASPYGGTVVEDIVARVNDQIITQSDYDRALQLLNEEGQQRGESMQEMADARRDLLRNLIDQQLWLSKGKELDIKGDTELVKRLDDIRKQYNLGSLEDLEKAVKDQGISWEDFQQNIRNQIITQDVMRQEVGEKIQFTPGEAMQYYEQHKQDYTQPESVRLSEILVSTGDDDPAKVVAGKTKADDLEAKLKAGGSFAELARTSSDGPTAAQGGDLGQFRRGSLAKVLEDKTFDLQAGQWTDPIRTRQGWVILKVTQHTPAGAQPYKDVQEQVDEALYMSRMEPAIRAYLTKMREEAFIDIRAGYEDTGASPNETKPVFTAYVPPAPKKKAKVERTRYRENTHGFRQKTALVSDEPAQTATAKGKKSKKKKEESERPGKREKIRFGQAPRETLPSASGNSNTVNAGALPEDQAEAEQGNEPANPLEATAPRAKTRFSARARTEKKDRKARAAALKASQTPAPPDAAEVADRETQSAPLGLGGNTATKKKKKKSHTTTGQKTRMSQEPRQSAPKTVPQMTPAPQEPGAPAPAEHPTAPQPAPQGQTQQ